MLISNIKLQKVYGFAFCFIQLLVSSISKRRRLFQLFRCRMVFQVNFAANKLCLKIKKNKKILQRTFFFQNAKTTCHSPIIPRFNKIYLIYRKHSTQTWPMLFVFTETWHMLHKSYIKLHFYWQHRVLVFLNESQSM